MGKGTELPGATNVPIIGGAFIVLRITVNTKDGSEVVEIQEPKHDCDPQQLLDLGSVMSMMGNYNARPSPNTLRVLQRTVEAYREKWGKVLLAGVIPNGN